MLVGQLLVFSIPTAFAAILHMFVVKWDWWPALKFPLDHHKRFRGPRIFGNSKTYRGLVAMMIFGVAGVFLLEKLLQWFPSIAKYNIIDFSKPLLWKVALGLLFGFAYILGELPNSFIKRQKGIPEGKSGGFVHSLIDQAESPIFCMLLTKAMIGFSWTFFAYGCIFYLALHLVINVLLYVLGLRKNPF